MFLKHSARRSPEIVYEMWALDVAITMDTYSHSHAEMSGRPLPRGRRHGAIGGRTLPWRGVLRCDSADRRSRA